MMDDNRCFLAANHIKPLENARLTVKYGARNALQSLRFRAQGSGHKAEGLGFTV